MSFRTCFVVALVGIAWSCVLGLQRPPPRYSQQYMPDTSFSCRNKIVGSYYADPETDCQLFHVCVSVAGSVQDYKFLCPNDTAFDQESQTCADWYDVDCEAATLYYASDNFDLYRLGSGLESLHYDSVRSDAEPQDHLQRSETSDAVRSSANGLNRETPATYKANDNGNANSRDILRGSSSINFYNSRNGGKDEDFDNEKVYRDETVQEPKKKSGVRKIARNQQQNINNNGNNVNLGNNYASSSTVAPVVASSPIPNNYNGNYYNNYNNRQRTSAFPSSTVPSSVAPDNHSVRHQNNQKYYAPTTTHRPSTAQQTFSTYQSPSTTIRTTAYNNYNNNNNNNAYSTNNNAYSTNNNQQQTSNSYGQSIVTSPKPTSYSQNYPSASVTTPRITSYNQNYQEQQTSKYGQNIRGQSTTVQPSTNYQSSDYTNYQRNYNNIQRSTSSPNTFPTTFAPTTFQDSHSTNHGNGYVPTTYRPPSINKAVTNDNTPITSNARSNDRQTGQSTSNESGQYNGQSGKSTQYYESTRSPRKNVVNENLSGQSVVRGIDRYNSQATGNDNGQYNNNEQRAAKSTQYYDSTRSPKKATQYNGNYDITNNGKYYESSTGSYDIGRSQAGIGFSPSSINRLAETPRTTTPVPKRSGSPTTYNPQNFNANNQRQTETTPRGTTYVSGSARPFSTTARFNDATTPRPKSGKKNDYDYAYYDNAGGLEYDGLDLEHVVAGNKESTKISRN